MVFHRVAVDTICFKVPDSLMGLETLQNLVSPRHRNSLKPLRIQIFTTSPSLLFWFLGGGVHGPHRA